MDAETTTQTPETGSEELAAAEAALAVMPGDDEVGQEADTEALESKATKLVGDITARRAVKRALDSDIAQRKAALETPAKAPEKSPMEKFVEETPDQIPSGEIHLAESKYQAALKATEEQAKSKQRDQETLTQRAKDVLARGGKKYSDFEEMHEAAGELLTNGDWLDIREAEYPEDLLYQRSIQRILAVGDKTSKELAQHLRAKKVDTGSVKKVPKETDGSETPTATRRSVHLARLHDVLG